MLCEQKAKLISSRVGADAAVKDKRKKDIIAANFKGALDAEIMIAKETGDLQNDSKLRRGLEVPKYNVFRHFSFQMDKQRSRINALWNSWLCIGIHPVTKTYGPSEQSRWRWHSLRCV